MIIRLNIKKRVWEFISLLIFLTLFYFIFKETDFLIEFITNSGPLAPFIAILVLTILGPTPIATDPIVILMGVTYGSFIGMIIGAIGNTGAMFIEYYFGSKLAEIFEYEKTKEKLPKFIQKFPLDSWVFLIFGRMIPGYGSKVISLIAGAEKVNIKTYLWTSIVSGIFGAFVLSYAGTEIFKLFKQLPF